jgi:glucan phosphoethanolaminetransferase (alkaline phosphatase superfamily)
MIQRVQTIYLFLAIICLGSTCLGLEFFRFVQSNEAFSFSVFGIESFKETSSTMFKSIPIYLSVIGLCLFLFMTLMSYKNLKRQLKWARSCTFLYTVFVMASIIFYYSGGGILAEGEYLRELGLGYALLIAGFPFCFLAQLGIKKDKKLLDSLDRLR